MSSILLHIIFESSEVLDGYLTREATGLVLSGRKGLFHRYTKGFDYVPLFKCWVNHESVEARGIIVLASVALGNAFTSGRSASGLDGKTVRMYKSNVNDVVVNDVRSLCEGIHRSGSGRLFWRFKRAKISEIPKQNDPTKVRVLSIPNMVDSAAWHAINIHLSPLAEAYFDRVWQESGESFLVCGSRPGFSTNNAITRLRYWVKGYSFRAIGKTPVLMFMDIANCFPSIKISYLIKVLKGFGVEKSIVDSITQGCKVQMIGNPQRVNGKRGIPQGSALSPLLCNLVVAHLIGSVVEEFKFMRVVTYLDDVAVLFPDSHDPEDVKERFRQRFAIAGLGINDVKTSIIRVNDGMRADYCGYSMVLKDNHHGFSVVPLVQHSTLPKFQKKLKELHSDMEGIKDVDQYLNHIKSLLLGTLQYQTVAFNYKHFAKLVFRHVFRYIFRRWGNKDQENFKRLKKLMFIQLTRSKTNVKSTLA